MSVSHNILVSLNTTWTRAVTIIKRVSFSFASIISTLSFNNHYLSVHSFFEIRQVKTLCNLLERTDQGAISGSELMLSGRKKKFGKSQGISFWHKNENRKLGAQTTNF